MQEHIRTARAATFAGASETRRRESTGLIECAIVSFAGLTVALLLIAHGAFASAAQLMLLQ